MNLMKTAFVALAACAVAAPAAMADVVSNKNQVTIETSDLDLNNPSDAQILLKRINSAAATACKDWETVIPNYQQSCRKQTVADNVARLNINALGLAYVDVYGEQPVLASRD